MLKDLRLTLCHSFLEDLQGRRCSPALTVKIENEASRALEYPFQELRDAFPDKDCVYMDESSTN